MDGGGPPGISVTQIVETKFHHAFIEIFTVESGFDGVVEYDFSSLVVRGVENISILFHAGMGPSQGQMYAA